MDFKQRISLIIYRFREKGLEVFLVNDEDNKELWGLPHGGRQMDDTDERFIELDMCEGEDGNDCAAVAVEGDWHEIPSLKSMLVEDAIQLKDKLKELDGGTYFALKEAFKRVLPHQYAFLHELTDILQDRNSVRDL